MGKLPTVQPSEMLILCWLEVDRKCLEQLFYAYIAFNFPYQILAFDSPDITENDQKSSVFAVNVDKNSY